jgi:hypothetical protein
VFQDRLLSIFLASGSKSEPWSSLLGKNNLSTPRAEKKKRS